MGILDRTNQVLLHWGDGGHKEDHLLLKLQKSFFLFSSIYILSVEGNYDVFELSRFLLAQIIPIQINVPTYLLDNRRFSIV